MEHPVGLFVRNFAMAANASKSMTLVSETGVFEVTDATLRSCLQALQDRVGQVVSPDEIGLGSGQESRARPSAFLQSGKSRHDDQLLERRASKHR